LKKRRKEEPESGIESSELDEMWSFVGDKKNPRWLWHGIDRSTGKVLRMFSADEKMKFFSS
jgi:insertion element IS1 protein InsB